MSESSAEPLKSVLLDARHRALGGRMVPFAGHELPVQYPSGIMAEHKWTREQAGLFDVSHMGPAFVTLSQPTGDADADHAAIAALVEPLVCGDIAGLKPGQIRYTLLLNEHGGVLDDLMIARSPLVGGELYIVVNAGTKDADYARFAEALGSHATIARSDGHYALLALQGPQAASVMEGLVPAATALGFMNYGAFEWAGETLFIARSGYTGEDGFEILVPRAAAEALWDALVADPRVKPIGLGARDSLRLEAGLPLYGHDLDPGFSPAEGNLSFAIGKRRRASADFPGAGRILRELSGALGRLRVGLLVEGAPAREGAEITDETGAVIGTVTSGGFAPSLGRAIAMGYVPPKFSEPGTRLGVLVRGRSQAATVAPMPFVPHRYFRKPAKQGL
ncbi:aminomethyltransferase [Devosia enhydra]|uniref:aminomethyltransferase n=1 Tax=Devosia enhydra TaxID=665118 RepID=A0A1K2I150_9HYPH|nr:glycine cleavage system aminomethyltransferase GcvT [Devosia enhydra]SFZ86110.1 aminomethyltransferase [Devosia enhydra]